MLGILLNLVKLVKYICLVKIKFCVLKLGDRVNDRRNMGKSYSDKRKNGL